MSVIEAMARAYLDALAPGGFRDPEERGAAALQRIGPMRAALAEARKRGWQLVPVEATQEMCKAAWESPPPYQRHDSTREMFIHEYTQRYRAMIAAAPSVEDNT